MRRLPAEWEHADAVLLAWPHIDSDWAPVLDDACRCYVDIAAAILPHAPLVIVAPDIEVVRRQLAGIDNGGIAYVEYPTNDTWTRDYGPITVVDDNGPLAIDFQFNGWGLKFASDRDNLVTQHIFNLGLIAPRLENRLGFTLEGGSIESDGNGTILTTERCLLSPNRNGDLNRNEIEAVLKDAFGARKVNWLRHGDIAGDDTDGHIDTLARLAPDNTILYVAPKQGDTELLLMEEELRALTDADGIPYRLVPLPQPAPVFDEDGNPMPATYANFLIVNGAVIVPTYGQPENDDLALGIISETFPDYVVKAVDCHPLITQHGSLHCSTMQLITQI